MILAIDCSSVCTGWAVLTESGELLACGEINLKSKTEHAMIILFNALNKLIQQHNPTRAIIESAYAHLNVAVYGRLEQFRGVCTLALLLNNVEDIHEIGASSVRKIVFGNGKMKKPEVCELLSNHFKQDLTTPGYDTSDAVALACSLLKITIKEKNNES